MHKLSIGLFAVLAVSSGCTGFTMRQDYFGLDFGKRHQCSFGNGGQPGDAGQPESLPEPEPVDPVGDLPPMVKISETKKGGFLYSRYDSEWEQVPTPGQEQSLPLARFRKVEKSVWPLWWTRRTSELVEDGQRTTEVSRQVSVGIGPELRSN